MSVTTSHSPERGLMDVGERLYWIVIVNDLPDALCEVWHTIC